MATKAKKARQKTPAKATRPATEPAAREKVERGSRTVTGGGLREADLERVSAANLNLRDVLEEEAVPTGKAEAEMRALRSLEEEHFEPEPLAHDVSMLVDETGAHEIVPGAQPVDDDVTLKRQAVRRARAADVQDRMLKGPLHRNVVRSPDRARDDLIAADLATTDEYRVAAAEAAQEDALDDLHVRRVDRLTDDQIARVRASTRAARQVRAEEIARLEKVGRRRDALDEVKNRIKAEGDSLAILEPDYVTRARHRAESLEQAESQNVRRTVPMTPEPFHERSLRPGQL